MIAVMNAMDTATPQIAGSVLGGAAASQLFEKWEQQERPNLKARDRCGVASAC